MEILIKHFNELTRDELYDILHLRAKIFVVEQNCPYVDPDMKDKNTYHLLLKDASNIVGTTRIFLPDKPDVPARIGRVAVEKTYRNQGWGKEILRASLDFIRKHFPSAPVEISAQLYLEEFYRSLGFQSVGKSYLEDGIPHIKMIKQ